MEHKPLGLSKISETGGIANSEVSRHLGILAENGLIEREFVTGRNYRITSFGKKNFRDHCSIRISIKAINDKEMLSKAIGLRKMNKSKKKPMPLKDILNINPEVIKKLKTIEITDVSIMLKEGKTIEKRKEMANRLKISYDVILELVKISDLTRIGYVKGKLTRLFYNAGTQTPAIIRKWKAEDLREHFSRYIQESSWEGIVPNLSDLKNNIESSNKIPDIIEYE